MTMRAADDDRFLLRLMMIQHPTHSTANRLHFFFLEKGSIFRFFVCVFNVGIFNRKDSFVRRSIDSQSTAQNHTHTKDKDRLYIFVRGYRWQDDVTKEDPP